MTVNSDQLDWYRRREVDLAVKISDLETLLEGYSEERQKLLDLLRAAREWDVSKEENWIVNAENLSRAVHDCKDIEIEQV